MVVGNISKKTNEKRESQNIITETTMENEFAIVVLAAGYSSRMDGFKSLLPIGDKTAIERLISSIKKTNIKDIVVVTGYQREKLSPIVATFGCKEAYNESFDKGMFSSIQKGISSLSNFHQGCFLLPVDYPLVDEKVLEKMMEKVKDNFAVPTFMGKKGHPLFIPKKYFNEIISYEGEGGLKGITDKYFESMQRIEVPYESVLMDMDNKEDYGEIKKFLKGKCTSDDLEKLSAGRTFYLMRHGKIKQHKEKIFLGQTDVPLCEEGREEARKNKSIFESLKTNKIYTSPLVRANDTARIVSGGKEIIVENGFTEMSLGSWDGKYISEIKEKYPIEYSLRGKNIWSFKIGKGSESFYDLQYRVWKTLCNILKKDKNKEIIIVAHKGILRAIENNLKGKSISESWDEMETGEVRKI